MGQIITKIAGNGLGLTYAAWIDGGQGHGLPPAVANLVARIGYWPRFSSLGRPGRRFPLHVVIMPGGGDAECTALFQWLDPEGETPITLTATDEDGSSNERYLEVVCEACQPVSRGERGGKLWHFVATCVVDGDVRWRAVTGDSTNWSVTSDGDTETIANGGEDEVYPVLTIEPTALRSGTYAYYDWEYLVWKAGEGDTSYPTHLASLDTAALVETATTTTLNGAFNAAAATCTLTDASSFANSGMAYITDAVTADEQIRWTGKSGNDLTGCTRGIGGTGDVNHSGGQTIAVSKMLANGDDLRVEVDGVEDENRWLDGMDSANTYVWLNLDWQAAQSYTLTNNIGAGDTVTSVEVDEDISGAPSSGAFLLNSEVFVYTSKNETDKTFTGVTRAARGTSAGAHTAADTLYWLQHDVKLKYGNALAGAPATDDDYKPVFTLASSSNGTWDYDNFGEDDGLRTGAWQSEEIVATATFYDGNHGGSADPWSDIGVYINWSASREGRWKIYNPCGITNANFQNGEKYAGIIGMFEGAVESSSDDSSWTNEYSIPAPGVGGAWESWSRNEAITAGMTWVAMRIKHKTGGTTDVYGECSDVTLTLNDTPTMTRSSEQTLYDLAATITNNTTGKAISLVYSMEVNGELEVDTVEKTVTDLDDDSNQRQALTVVSGPRRHWLALAVGNNELQYDESGVSAVTVTVEFEKRYYS